MNKLVEDTVRRIRAAKDSIDEGTPDVCKVHDAREAVEALESSKIPGAAYCRSMLETYVLRPFVPLD